MSGYDYYTIEDFMGGMNTQIRGIDLARNEAILLQNAWVEIVRDERGRWKGIVHKRKGYTPYNSTALTNITSMEDCIRFRKNATGGGVTAGTKLKIVCGNHATANQMHKDNGAGGFTQITQATTAFGANKYMMMLPFRDYLIVTDGTNILQAFPKTATTTDNLIHTHGAIALPIGKYLASADDRLFVSGGTPENRIWYSETGLYSSDPFVNCDFSADGSNLNFFDHPKAEDGDSVTGLLGTFDDDLLVFRQHDVSRLMGHDEDDYVLQEIESENGAVDARAVAKAGKYAIWVSCETKKIMLYDGGATHNIGEKVETYLKNENFTASRAIYYPTKRLVLISYRQTAAYNDYTLVYHAGIKELTGLDVWAVWDIGFDCFMVEDKTGDDGSIYGGDPTAGTLHQIDTGVNDNGGNIDFKYHSPHFSMGLPDNRKIWRGINLGVKAANETPFTITANVDIDRSTQAITSFYTGGFLKISEVRMGIDKTGPGDYQTFKTPLRNGMQGTTLQVKIETNDKVDLSLYRLSLQNKVMPSRKV